MRGKAREKKKTNRGQIERIVEKIIVLLLMTIIIIIITIITITLSFCLS